MMMTGNGTNNEEPHCDCLSIGLTHPYNHYINGYCNTDGSVQEHYKQSIQKSAVRVNIADVFLICVARWLDI